MSSFLLNFLTRVSVLVPILMGTMLGTVIATDDFTLPPDFIDRMVKEGDAVRLTLPNGQQVVGKIESIQRAGQGMQRVSGVVQHPEAGTFSFESSEPGKLQGALSFDSKQTEWKVEANAEGGGFRLVEAPVADAFRPRKMGMPTAAKVQPGLSRDEAEATLRKGLNIEKVSEDKLRLGQVELDKPSRSIRFPATVNMRDGIIEYAVVAHTGKCHEALFATTASPRDIHLAMLLLGVKPAKFAASPDAGLLVPANAAVTVIAEWQQDGQKHSHPLSELFAAGQSASAMRDGKSRSPLWLYNGSKFNGAGFTALVEGSIVSLIADDTALINNPGKDRGDDGIHLPNSSLLPATGTQVTLIFSPHRP
jgi:hypothetical protein